MVWTSPKTWAVNDIMTAADLNTYIRDNSNAISKLTTYVPVWSGTVTNPAIGNGILLGRYIAAEEWCWFQIYLKAGSSTTYGSGGYGFTLPLTTASVGEQIVLAAMLNVGISRYVGLGVCNPSSTSLYIAEPPAWSTTSVVTWTATTPFTFANTDECSVQGIYRRV